MRKFINRVLFCGAAALLLWTAALAADRDYLQDSLIRMHIVANSDSEEDQTVKLQVRDAVLNSIRSDLSRVSDIQAAREYLQDNLPKLEAIAERTLKAAGFEETVEVSLCREAFDTRDYETFSLPAGVYEALRIVIGKGEGQNWWCVSFPSLCLPATTSGFQEAAACAGFSDTLCRTLTEDYEVRFFLLDALGKLENIFFPG